MQARFVPTAVGASLVRNLWWIMRCVTPVSSPGIGSRGILDRIIFNTAKWCHAHGLTDDVSEPESEE